MRDATAVTLAARRVRRGDLHGALTLLTRQAEHPACPGCDHPVSEEWQHTGCELGATG